MLVLKTLSVEPMHGYAIARQIERVSDDVLRIKEGSLYPALQRMRQKGWVKAEWRQTPNNQKARYYTTTAAGRKQLGAEEAGFAEMLAAISRVMSTKVDRHSVITNGLHRFSQNILSAEDAKEAQRH